jgi:enoyl-CoA hydratase/carnithine racemase
MTVRYERDGRVLVVRIEREERRNAIDRELRSKATRSAAVRDCPGV